MAYDFENEKVRALSNRIKIKVIRPPEKTKSGLYLPNQADVENSQSPPNYGIVQSIGKDVTLDIQVGDEIIFDPRGLDAYVRMDYHSEAEFFILDKFVFAVVEKN